MLLDNGRFTLLVDLEQAFVERYEREQRELSITVTTAIEIDDAKAADLGERLEAATGQRITIERRRRPRDPRRHRPAHARPAGRRLRAHAARRAAPLPPHQSALPS